MRFMEELEGVLRRYAEAVTAVEREARAEFQKIEEADLDWDEEVLREEEVGKQRDDKLLELDDEVGQEIFRLAEAEGLELLGGVFECVDSHIYASGMGFRHTRLIYSVVTIKLSPTRIKHIFADFTESEVYGRYELTLDGLREKEGPLISEETTPKTIKVIKAIPWELIRPIWGVHIGGWLTELAEAETEDRFEEKVREIKETLKPELWVYDYAHFYNALKSI